MRSCVSCGAKAAKRELLRVVSPPQGAVSVDTGGRLDGRGAYLCERCRKAPKALRRGRLEYSLRTKIAEDDWHALLKALSDDIDG